MILTSITNGSEYSVTDGREQIRSKDMTREEIKDFCDMKAQLEPENEDIFKAIIKTLEQEPEPVYFPPCVDCQDRSKEILTAYNNMKKMQTFTKEEVISMLDKIRAKCEQGRCVVNNDYDHGRNYGLYMATQIIDLYKAESEGNK